MAAQVKRAASGRIDSSEDRHKRRQRRPRREPLPDGVIPCRFSAKKTATVQQLRHWEHSDRNFTESQLYKGDLLVEQQREGRVWPMMLPAFAHEEPRVQVLLGLLVSCCFVRKGRALDIKKAQVALLLKCCEKTAYTKQLYCQDEGWILKDPQFVKQKSHGKKGEKLNHRQRANWLIPGPRLVAAWHARQQKQREKIDRLRGLVQPSAQSSSASSTNYLPSLRSHQPKAPYARARQAPTHRHLSRRVDKVSPPQAGTIEKAPSPTATTGAAYGGGAAGFAGLVKPANQEPCRSGLFAVRPSGESSSVRRVSKMYAEIPAELANEAILQHFSISELHRMAEQYYGDWSLVLRLVRLCCNADNRKGQ